MMSEQSEVATLAGGCFWCVEAVYEQVQGVQKVVSGYSGGKRPNPTYEQVCTGATGHAEVVQVTFDPASISYREILEIFFATHDPTTRNRQGADVGTQYRSAIYYHSDAQQSEAERIVAELDASGAWDDPIVTEIGPIEAFYRAEDYHQGYYRRNPHQGYCAAVITPKLSKFRKTYASRLKV